MKIKEALASVGSVLLPSIPASSSTLDAIRELRRSDSEAILVKKTGESAETALHAVSGYSIIARLSNFEPKHYSAFLSESCINSALSIGEVSMKDDLISLLHMFETTEFGYAMVDRSGIKTPHIMTVRSLLKLYEFDTVSSDLVAREVASSPVFSVPRSEQLRDALREMLNRKFRRVLVSGTKKVVSDRQILNYAFDETRIRAINERPERLLDGTLEELEAQEAIWSEGNKSLKAIAKLMTSGRQDCALTDDGIITPWDLVLKPWRLGRLSVTA